jgi:hypothetical protein
LRRQQLFNHSGNFQHFTEVHISSMYSQVTPTLSQMNPVHYLPSYFLKTHILRLSYHLSLCLPRYVHHSGFPARTFNQFLFYSMHATCPTYLVFLHFIILRNNIWIGIHDLLIKEISQASCYLFLPRSKYFLQHFVHRHPVILL